MQTSVKTGGVIRWNHYLNIGKLGIRWTSDDNRKLLELQSVHLNKWKTIASQLPERTGDQVKNQFFNLVRTLLRKAFKMTFRKSETVFVSAIKPKVLSELVNRPLGIFLDWKGSMGEIAIRDFLVDFVGKKGRGCEVFTHARIILQNLKEYMLKVK